MPADAIAAPDISKVIKAPKMALPGFCLAALLRDLRVQGRPGFAD
jgi:hypothetical protein